MVCIILDHILCQVHLMADDNLTVSLRVETRTFISNQTSPRALVKAVHSAGVN